MNSHPSNDPPEHTGPASTASGQEPPHRALAVGFGGPAWWPPARASAENFNPFHDELGRFTTGGGAAAPGYDARMNYTDVPSGPQTNGPHAQKQSALEYHGKVSPGA